MNKQPTIQSPCGCLLTHEQARTVAARLTNALRVTRKGGRPKGSKDKAPRKRAKKETAK